jgi:hypothetical protein
VLLPQLERMTVKTTSNATSIAIFGKILRIVFLFITNLVLSFIFSFFGLLFTVVFRQIVFKYEFIAGLTVVIYIIYIRPILRIAKTGKRYGVVSAGVKRITPEDTRDRQYGSNKKATFLICLKGIGGACRRKPTARFRFKRG